MKKINNWIYKMAVKVLAKRLVKSETHLTPEYLMAKGWKPEWDSIKQKVFYCEPNVKDRDRIYVEFESWYYRLWHSSDKTFIAHETSVEWFEMYYLLAHPDNGRHQLAGV